MKSPSKNIKPNKAAGPDGISGRILKTCCKELADIFRQLFQWSLDYHIVPRIWKASTITPVPKMSKPKESNDFRPIALTATVMKCFEHIIKDVLLDETNNLLDPFQFAYRANRGVSDCIILTNILTNLKPMCVPCSLIFLQLLTPLNHIFF